MNIKHLALAMACAACSAQVAAQAPAAQPAPAAAAPVGTPKTAEEWLQRMTDFTRNASAFKDPQVFVPWSNAVTEPGFYIAAMNGMMDPAGWLAMMNSAAHPGAVRNLAQFGDPNVTLRWMAAGVDPAFYTAVLTQLSDPGKMMRWGMMPLDPKLWNLFMNSLNPNTYIRWPMAMMDPRLWNLMGNMANPALYTSMAGAAFNAQNYGPTVNSWMNWTPPTAVVGASNPWAAGAPTGFNMFDPMALGGLLAGMVPGLSQPAPALQMPAAPVPAPKAAPAPVPAPAPKAVEMPKAIPAPAPVLAAPATPAAPAAAAPNKVVLAGDALFQSGKSGIRNLSKEGKARLDEVVAKLKGMGDIDQIRVVGHADPTGNATANRKLSEARAKSVKSYLVAKGVKPGVIITSGMGDAQPVVQCDPNLPKADLKECHAPNRRVEIEIVAKPK